MILNADGWTLVGTLQQVEAFLQKLCSQHQILNVSKLNIVLLQSPINTATVALAIEPLTKRRSS